METPTPSVLGIVPNEYLELYEVSIGLSALRAGEVQRLFQPGGRGNKPANSYSLAWARLRALEWKVALQALGYPYGKANNLISQAFGEQWDTIRKWRKSCGAVLDDFLVTYCIAKAKDVSRYQIAATGGMFGKPRTAEEDLQVSGNRYRQELVLAAAASKSKGGRKTGPSAFPDK